VSKAVANDFWLPTILAKISHGQTPFFHDVFRRFVLAHRKSFILGWVENLSMKIASPPAAEYSRVVPAKDRP
jgi:hypothetical protein